MTRRTRSALLLTALAAGCGGNKYAPPPPPEVTVARPVEREVTTWAEFTGQTASVESVQIRARVQGILESVSFQPGSQVQKGDLLFVIEPALYQARFEQAEADLKGAEAQARAAEEQLAITQAIFERKAGSRTDVVQKTQARDQALAAVAQAKATLAAARLDVSYTHIYAPISGQIDRNMRDVGNLVGAGEATLLASIYRQDPIYAYFDVSERGLLDYRERRRRGQTATPEGGRTPAYMALATDADFTHEGEVDYASNRVDPSTGTMELRAVFPNPDFVIVPGLFVRIRVPLTRGRALLVPDEAVGLDQGGRYVLVVDDQGAVEYRRVEIGALEDRMRVVEKGLQPTEWIVVNGLQRARPGSKVQAKRTDATAPVDGGPARGAAG